MNSKAEVLCFSYDEDGSYILIGTNKGFGIYQTSMFKLKYSANCGGVSLIEMLQKSNIVILVGAGETPDFSQRVLRVWDVSKDKFVHEITIEDAKILNIKINYRLLLVGTERTCYIYTLPDMKLIREIKCYNPNGVMALSQNKDFEYLCFVNKTPEIDCAIQLFVPDIMSSNKSGESEKHLSKEIFDLELQEEDYKILKLESIQNITFNQSGDKIAFAYSNGINIAVYKAVNFGKNGEIITFYRGNSSSTIYNLSFSKESNYLLNTSNKGTIHIYEINSDSHNKAREAILSGGINFSEMAHSFVQGAKQIMTGKSETIKKSIIKHNYGKKVNFVAFFSKASAKLIYIFDNEGYFTELRISESATQTDPIFAEEILN